MQLDWNKRQIAKDDQAGCRKEQQKNCKLCDAIPVTEL